MIKKIIILIFVLYGGIFLKSMENAEFELVCIDTIVTEPSVYEIKEHLLKPHPLRFLLKKKITRHQRFVAAALAFPFPFGIVGLHRIYMGTRPHVPVLYIATFGGAFGVLPFIDFCILMLDKKAERYFNNPRLFMWIEPETNAPMNSSAPSANP
ncbi:MAG: TM2 domain-containing protein [Bacteroidia bacterium]|nr:TM2 domain-containing protein [Bacteroidia bacterium]